MLLGIIRHFNDTTTMFAITAPTPIGECTIVADDTAVLVLDMHGVMKKRYAQQGNALLKEAWKQLNAYLAGRLKKFDLPLLIQGTYFQKRVWQFMQTIPYGDTMSYGEVAHHLSSGPRAVGGACGKNHIPIIIPCHRILAANQKIGGFTSPGGTETKRFLLALEGAQLL